MPEPLLISNSEIQTFKDCRRRWYLTYYRELGLKRRGAKAVGARELGSRVHVALHALYADGSNPLDVLDQIYAQDISEYPEQMIELQKEQQLAKIMVEGFLVWREDEGIDEGMELIAAETVIEVASPIENVRLRGKLDQRWHRKRDGVKLFRDWKTVADMATPAMLLPMDEQFKFYMMLEQLHAREQGKDRQQWKTAGGQYAMLRKVKRTAAAKPPFYDVVEVQHNDATMRSMYYRVLKVIEEIVATRAYLDDGDTEDRMQYAVPPRPSKDCKWKCDFFAVCPLMDDGSNWQGLLAEYYTHLDPHERYNAEDDGKEVTK